MVSPVKGRHLRGGRLRAALGILLGGIGFVPVAQALAEEAGRRPSPGIEDIIEVVEIGSLSASPDGRTVAFRTQQARIEQNTHLLTWHVADLDAGMARPVAGGGAPIYADPGVVATEPPLWSADSRSIVYRALVEDAIGIWRAGIDGGGVRRVFRDESDVETLTAEGGHALVTLGPSRDAIRAAEREEYLDGILVDASVPLNQNLVRSGFVNGRLATQRLRGPWFTRVGLLWDAPRRQRTLDLATLELGPATPAPPPPALPEVGVDPGISARSAAGALVRSVRVNGETKVEATLPDRRNPVRCMAQACQERVVAVAWRPGSGQVLLTTQDRHLGQSLHLWDLASGAVRQIATSDGYLAGGSDGRTPCAVTHSHAVCVAASTLSPPRLERIDLATGQRSVLFDPNPALREADMPSVERLAWSTLEGESFTGVLLLPPRSPGTRLPLFVNYYHCGGFLSGGVGDELPFIPLANSGMAVACINLPPPNGAEDFLGRYPQGLRAVRSLVESLDELGTIDPQRVGMAGLSFGSEVTMWTLFNSDLLAAAAIASSQIEPTYYWFSAVRGSGQPEVLRRFWGLGSPEETPEAWRRQSAAFNTDRIYAPLLMQLPETEARDVIELHARLSRSPTPTELHVFPDAAHLKIQPRHRLAAYRRYLDWFRFWLQGHSDPDPAKAEQYRRWRQLRERWRAAASPTP